MFKNPNIHHHPTSSPSPSALIYNPSASYLGASHPVDAWPVTLPQWPMPSTQDVWSASVTMKRMNICVFSFHQSIQYASVCIKSTIHPLLYKFTEIQKTEADKTKVQTTASRRGERHTVVISRDLPINSAKVEFLLARPFFATSKITLAPPFLLPLLLSPLLFLFFLLQEILTITGWRFLTMREVEPVCMKASLCNYDKCGKCCCFRYRELKRSANTNICDDINIKQKSF